MEENERVRLEIIGVTFNQIESGVYAVVLQEAGGNRRVPIIIGAAEAQAIECKLQGIQVPRPLTHDLLEAMMRAFGLTLEDVEIHQLSNGVFAANLTVTDRYGNRAVIDARSSDAIALAVRTDTPLFTSRRMLQEVGFVPGSGQQKRPETPQSTAPRPTISKPSRRRGPEDMSVEELEEEMNKAAASENYELAARLKEELRKRRGEDA